MDSLKIQDAFEPYYAGRKRFAARREKGQPASADDARKTEARKRLLRRRPKTGLKAETDSTTEH